MNEKIKLGVEKYRYPCLVFFLKHNPDYGKTFNIDDIEKPSKEVYTYYLCDCATLGRTAISYEEWAKKCQESKLKSIVASSKCSISMEKYGVSHFNDIDKIEKIDGFIRYVDPILNEYFGVEK